ncbi:MAG: S58 family peptidase [Clostridia bacterium]|nr:S58 family peptidase [Clostridia bacterium]
MFQMRAADYGLRVGSMPSGPRNKITDVPGVLVGHCTVDSDDHKTGVTMVLPGPENPFTHKLPAAVCAYNGFGKTAGLMQLQELGTLETPIALTNTLNVGAVSDALVEYMITRCETEGVTLHSVNPVVAECNDATLNHIQERAVGKEHVFSALAAAAPEFDEGAVGAGTGTICHGLKGGIGSASRTMEFDGKTYTLGVLVQSNHGVLKDLTVGGHNIGASLSEQIETRKADQGSIIAVLATDLPLDSRQLGRVAKRVSVGLARLGSYIGHGSGEVFLAFSTANAFDVRAENAVRMTLSFHEEYLDVPFRAAAECAEEAVLNSMLTAKTTVGYQGRTATALLDLWKPSL